MLNSSLGRLLLISLTCALTLTRADAVISADNKNAAGGISFSWYRLPEEIDMPGRRWTSSLLWDRVPKHKSSSAGKLYVRNAEEAARVSGIFLANSVDARLRRA
jgi:hypothetical protein